MGMWRLVGIEKHGPQNEGQRKVVGKPIQIGVEVEG